MHPFYKNKENSRGFSLVELLVSIGIMVVILGVVVFGQQKYTEATNLTNLADEIAIAVSQAQAYGNAVRETSAGSANFDSGYGISVGFLEEGGEFSYIYFADIDRSQYYDGDLSCAHQECIEKVEITKGNYIDSFCVLRTQGSDQCGVAERVDISFARPETDAVMKIFNSGGNSYNTPNLEGVEINLRSPNGLTKSVIVYKTGQVSVQ